MNYASYLLNNGRITRDDFKNQMTNLSYKFAFQRHCEDDYNESDTGQDFCRASYDGLMCWPPGLMGTRQLSCPENYRGVNFDYTNFAYRNCSAGGVWASLSNYRACQIPINSNAVEIITIFGYVLTLVSLTAAILIFCTNRSISCLRNKIHCQFFISLLCRAVLEMIRKIVHLKSVTVHIKPYNDLVDNINNTIFTYFLLTVFFWMLNEGLYLFTIVLFPYKLDVITFRHFIIVGWVGGLIFDFIWFICVVCVYGIGRSPWWMWSTDNYYNKVKWVINGPIFCILFINAAILMVIIYTVIVKQKMTSKLNYKDHNRKSNVDTTAHSNGKCKRVLAVVTTDNEGIKALKAAVVLFPILGLTYLVLPIAAHPSVVPAYEYVNDFLTSTQGFWVALFYCFLNNQVRKALRSKYTSYRDVKSIDNTKRLSRYVISNSKNNDESMC